MPAAIAAASTSSSTTIPPLAIGEMSPSKDPREDPAGVISCRDGGEKLYLAAATPPVPAELPPPLGLMNATSAVTISLI